MDAIMQLKSILKAERENQFKFAKIGVESDSAIIKGLEVIDYIINARRDEISDDAYNEINTIVKDIIGVAEAHLNASRLTKVTTGVTIAFDECVDKS